MLDSERMSKHEKRYEVTSIKHGNVIGRIALFGVAISFKSRTRVVAFSVTRLLKSRRQPAPQVRFNARSEMDGVPGTKLNDPMKNMIARDQLGSSRHIFAIFVRA